MPEPAVQEVIPDLIAREVISGNSSFSFHGAAQERCYLVDCGISDSETGEILGVSPKMVRHYSKRARALMVARGAAERMTGAPSSHCVRCLAGDGSECRGRHPKRRS